jgi:hypothetical protein
MAESTMTPFREMAGKNPEEAKFFWSGGPIEVAPRTWFQSYLSGVTGFETDAGLLMARNIFRSSAAYARDGRPFA